MGDDQKLVFPVALMVVVIMGVGGYFAFNYAAQRGQEFEDAGRKKFCMEQEKIPYKDCVGELTNE